MEIRFNLEIYRVLLIFFIKMMFINMFFISNNFKK